MNELYNESTSWRISLWFYPIIFEMASYMILSSSPTEKGQGLVEYALIMVLIALVVIVALTLLGPSINTVYARVNDLFPGVASPVEPSPVATEEPFGYSTEIEAFNVFCSTYTGTDHMHVHYNSTTNRFIGLANLTTSPAGFTILPPFYCPISG